MGDVSAEPSMEDILSSIKRIIAEEGEAPGRARRSPRSSSPPDAESHREVLELSDPIAEPEHDRPPPLPATAIPAEAASFRPVDTDTPEPIVSRSAAEASRGSLDALTRLVVKPEPGSDGTLEGLVREMLRPMLREWLDANLPTLVKTMVSKEIARIAGSDR